MLSRHKVIARVAMGIGSLAVAILLCLYVSEHFFFDKFYYRKSPTFGYREPLPNPLANTDNPPSLERRLRDLRVVFDKDLAQKADAKVLGTSSDQPFVVFLIGDSYVYGNGVRENERMSTFLEQKLNAIRPTKVYTLAQSGDSIMDNYYKLQAAEKIAQPNVVIMGMVVNDFILDQYDKYPDEQAFYDQLRQECPQEEKKITWLGPEMTPEQGMEYNLYPSVDPQYANMCYYESILRNMEGKPVMFYSFDALAPDPPAAEETYAWQGWQVMHAYAQRARNHGFEVVSPNNIEHFVFTPRATQEGHPSVNTHELYAESMFTEITSNPKWHFHQ